MLHVHDGVGPVRRPGAQILDGESAGTGGEDQIVPVVAGEHGRVVSGSAVERVVPWPSDEGVVPIVPDELIVAGETGEGVVEVTADKVLGRDRAHAIHGSSGQLTKQDITGPRVGAVRIRSWGADDHVVQAIPVYISGRLDTAGEVTRRNTADLETISPVQARDVDVRAETGCLAKDDEAFSRVLAVWTGSSGPEDNVIKSIAIDVPSRGCRPPGALSAQFESIASIKGR